MVSRKNSTDGSQQSDGSCNSSLTYALKGAKSTVNSTKRRQTSIRNFFGNAATSTKKKTTSFQDNSKKGKTPCFCSLTPPTPISPQTPLTPPTEQAPPGAVATPPSSVGADCVALIFKKAKRDSTPTKAQTDSVNTFCNSGKPKKALEQTYLDLGQKSFAKRTICNTCGMLYVHGLNEDSQQHSRICMDYMKGVPFTIPQARLVSSYLNGSIVEVRHSDNYSLRSKVKRVKEIVDRDLGFVPSETTSPETRTVYLYIANKRVVGFASAEIIKHAFVLHNSFERSTEPQNAMAGVHQLWVHAKFRNQGIATRLVDTIREKLVFGLTVPKVFLAFSSPTEAGARFARNYCGVDNGTKDILVYDCT